MEGLYLLAAHFLGDWPLQTDRMAVEKFDNTRVRATHVAIYTATVTAVYLLATTPTAVQAAVFAGVIGVTHFVVDSRRWKPAVDGFPTRALWFDQVYHILTLAAAVAIIEVVL